MDESEVTNVGVGCEDAEDAGGGVNLESCSGLCGRRGVGGEL